MKAFVFMLLILCTFSCNSDEQDELDCSLVLCQGRPSVFLQIVDVDSQEIYFSAVTDTAPEGLTVTLDDGGQTLIFGQSYFIVEGQIQINQFPDAVRLVLEDEFDVTISSDIESIPTEGCCSNFEISNTTASSGSLEQLDDEGLFFRLTI